MAEEVPTSFAFNTRELSVSLLSLEAVERLLARGEYAAIAALNVGYCRSIELEVRHDPIIDDDGTGGGEPDHVLVIMEHGRGARAKRLKAHAVVVSVDAGAAELHHRLSGWILRREQVRRDIDEATE